MHRKEPINNIAVMKYSRNSAIIESLICLGSSFHLHESGRNLLILCPLALGHVGSGHWVYRERTALQRHKLQTRAPGATSSSRKPY